jgi:cellulose synthase/poly-beta-1,6-N-acetylglucosamine synthase-like glycosyltransferase
MDLISTKMHGMLDYIVSLFLISCPWLFAFARGGVETFATVIIAVATIIYSLFTNYELGLLKVISMRIHLLLDLVSAFALAFSPWIFGFSDQVWVPHVIIAVLELVVVAMSVSVAGTELKSKKLTDFGSMDSSR